MTVRVRVPDDKTAALHGHLDARIIGLQALHLDP